MNYAKLMAASVSATLVMTVFMLLAPYIYLPKMNVGHLLGAMFGQSDAIGWVLHFVLGIVFGYVYVAVLNDKLPVENHTARGTIYGIIVFVFSEVILTLINFMGYLNWTERESMAKMVFGNALACLIYGAVLGSFYKSKDTGLSAFKPV
ncbi:MAG TPA: DUF6789 family protein [Chitinophagales bacterium]|nr:DUF6789 family protein [Chitinophagales bacterium]